MTTRQKWRDLTTGHSFNSRTKSKLQYKRTIQFYIILFLFLVFTVSTWVSKWSRIKTVNNSNHLHRESRDQLHYHDGQLHRQKRDISELLEDEENKSCLPRSVDEFPGNFMTFEDTRDGGFFIHILIAVYLFGALAIVCDDYFVASLEMICEELNLKEDVAGATFMAAGSSAPELATAIIGVFVAKSDVGIGTIVGSAVFNVLVIIGVCGVFAGMVVTLTWWPLVRDCLYYTLSVLAMILVINDGEVYWYEALILFLMYVIYIIIMYFNKRLEDYFEGLYEKFKARRGIIEDAAEEKQSLIESEGGKPIKPEGGKRNSFNESDERVKSAESETRFSESSGNELTASLIATAQHYDSPWEIPDTFLARIYWVAMVPVRALVYFSIPDCRRQGKWRKTFPITFIMSILWISGMSYVMVWMVAIAGDAIDIPDTVMGLTLLAAGTSVPDCLASLFVARDGYGDMAVSNSIGSNVFDILMCLGFPWLINTVAVNTGSVVKINSGGLLYSSITLLATVIFLIAAIVINKWRLNKPLGSLFMFVYLIVITFSCLYELNIFGEFNLPSCERT